MTTKQTYDWIATYEEYMDKMQQKYDVPGIAVGVGKDGVVAYERGFGYRNKEDKLGVTSDTIFGLASITKSFTCAAIMRCQELDMLDVHDEVIKYLPEFKTPNEEYTKQITIHHFMTHTAGIPPLSSLFYCMKRSMDRDESVEDYPGLKINQKWDKPIDTYEQLMEFMGDYDYELLGAPGEVFSYSNDAYALLGAIVERVSGESLQAFMHKHIFEPAGMTRSTFELETVLQSSNVTMQYAKKNEDDKEIVYAAPEWWDGPSMRGAGFIKSTIRDMLKYAEIYRTNGLVGDVRILSEASVKQMTHPHFQFDHRRSYGYGLMITPNVHGGTLIDHGGSLKAISSNLGIIPEQGLTSIVLTNLAGVPAFQLMKGSLNAFNGVDPAEPVAPRPQYDGSIEEQLYVGEYATDEGAELSIAIEEEKLVLVQEGTSYPLVAIGEHTFVAIMGDSETYVRFHLDGENTVYRMALGLRQVNKVDNDIDKKAVKE